MGFGLIIDICLNVTAAPTFFIRRYFQSGVFMVSRQSTQFSFNSYIARYSGETSSKGARLHSTSAKYRVRRSLTARLRNTGTTVDVWSG